MNEEQFSRSEFSARSEPSLYPPTDQQSENARWRGSFRQVLALLAVGLLIVAAVWALSERGENKAAGVEATTGTAPEVGSLAPDLALKDLTGDTVRLSSYRGKTVLLNFWATWCPPCRAEMPDLEALHKENVNNDVVVVGVNVGEDQETAAGFVRSLGLTFPILLDSDSTAQRDHKVGYLPTTFFIDSDGIIREIRIGAMKKSTMELKLKQATQGR